MTFNTTEDTHRATQSEIKQRIEVIERLMADADEIKELIKEAFDAAKGTGLDVKVMRMVIARRRKDRDAVAEEDALLSLYEDALG